jgi:putative nucleotidyltransferase with HDIG domain
MATSPTARDRDRERRPRLLTPGSSGAIPVAPVPRWNRAVRQAKCGWQRLLARDAFWLAVFVLVATWALVPSRRWSLDADAEVGTIAARDFLAPRDALVLDAEATAEKERRAAEEVLPVYDLDTAAAERVVDELQELFATGRQAPDGETVAQLQTRLQRADVTLAIAPAQLALLRNREFPLDLLDRLRAAFEGVLGRGVVAGKDVLLENRERGVALRDLATAREQRQLDLYDYLDYPDDVRALLAVEVRSWTDYPAAERAQLLDLLLANVNPNLHLNQSETVRRRAEAAAAVEQVFNRVRRGQVIVRKGDQIDAVDVAVIAELAGRPGRGTRALPILGMLLLTSAVGLLMWLGIRQERVVETRRPTVLGEAVLLLLSAVLGARVCHVLATSVANTMEMAPLEQAKLYFFAVPFAALALIVVLLYGRGLALVMSLAYSMLAGVILEDSSWAMVLYAMAGSLAAIITVDHFQFKQRSVMVRAGGVVSLVSMACVLMLAATSGAEIDGKALLWSLLFALGGGMATAAVAGFFIPVSESLFQVTTGIKLVELANTNLPLLRRLAFEAPGTFQHSLMVANLAKAGCESIGADSVLAYTAALYHDIGKILRPEYFVENQRPGQNRHDKLLPSMSALILINHVKDGLELAREHHLPEPIQDGIAEHHGTRLITWFFNKAKEMHDPQAGELAAEKFRYPGPRPHNKVMGVLMLADGVEAACRSLEDPSPVRLRTVIKAITDDCLRDGQLDETDLTLGDLNRVAEAFQRVLTHIHHRRLDYPGFDFNGRRRNRRATDVDETAVEAAPESPGDATGGGSDSGTFVRPA